MASAIVFRSYREAEDELAGYTNTDDMRGALDRKFDECRGALDREVGDLPEIES